MSEAKSLKEELEDILQTVANSQEIKNYELDTDLNMKIGDGFVGQFYYGSIRNKDTGETIDVAIKKAPLGTPEFDFAQIFQNEGLFYSQIFPALDEFQKEKRIEIPFNNVPKFYGSSMASKKEYIVMENLKTIGYTLWDKKKFLDEEHLELIFKTYGKFHAISFVLKNENREKYTEVLKGTTDIFEKLFSLDAMFNPFKASFGAAVSALDPEVDKNVIETVNKYLDGNKEVYINITYYKGNYSCITHGDCWSNNMLFKYKDSGKLQDMRLIDFQLTRDGTPVHDLSYFFYSGASKPAFDKLDIYLEIYHKSFSEYARELGGNPDKLLPLHVLKNEWKQNALLGIFMGIYLWQVKLLDKEKITTLMSDTKTPQEMKMKMWTDIMEQMFKSDDFRERTKDILIHAVEYGVVF